MTIRVTIKHDEPLANDCLMVAEVIAGQDAPVEKGAWTVIKPGDEATFHVHKFGHLYVKETDPKLL